MKRDKYISMAFSFKEFLSPPERLYRDIEVVHFYMQHPSMAVKEIASKTNRSIGEVYRIVKRHGSTPNRVCNNHENVHAFAKSGIPVYKIAELTGYTPRNVRYILNGSRSK